MYVGYKFDLFINHIVNLLHKGASDISTSWGTRGYYPSGVGTVVGDMCVVFEWDVAELGFYLHVDVVQSLPKSISHRQILLCFMVMYASL